MKKVLLLVVFLLLNSSVIGKNLYVVAYNSKLTSVNLSIDSKKQEIKSSIEELNDKELSTCIYNDSLFYLAWKVDVTRFSLLLKNKTSATMSIDWNKVTFVDCYNEVHRVVPSGTKYISHDSYIPPATLPQGTTLSCDIVPTNNIFINAVGKWVEKVIIPCYYTSEEARQVLAGSFIGKKMMMIIPIENEGKIFEYTFTFTIDSIVGKGEKKLSGGNMKKAEKIFADKIVK